MKPSDRLCNVPFYYVIVWLNTASAEDQGLRLHFCLNFIFNKVPERVRKNFILCSLWFCLQTRHKVTKDFQNAVSNIYDLTVMPCHTSVTLFITNRGHYCFSVITDCLIWTEYLCVFNLNHSAVHLWKTAIIPMLANHTSGCLLSSLKSATHHFKQRFHDEGVKTGQNILHSNFPFFFFFSFF